MRNRGCCSLGSVKSIRSAGTLVQASLPPSAAALTSSSARSEPDGEENVMVQSLTEPLTDAAQGALRAGRLGARSRRKEPSAKPTRDRVSRGTAKTGSTEIASETCTTQTLAATISTRSLRTAPTRGRPLPARSRRGRSDLSRSAVPRGVGRRGWHDSPAAAEPLEDASRDVTRRAGIAAMVNPRVGCL